MSRNRVAVLLAVVLGLVACGGPDDDASPRTPITYGCAYVRDYRGSLGTSRSHDRTDECLDKIRCEDLHEPGGSSFGAEYGYHGTTTFTDRVTFVGTCKEHTPLVRASLLDEALTCEASASCPVLSVRARSLRPAPPQTYGCAYTVLEYIGSNPRMTETPACENGKHCADLERPYFGQNPDRNGPQRSFGRVTEIIGTCEKPVPIQDHREPDFDECERAPRSCTRDPNCLAYRDCIAVCQLQTDCTAHCYREGEPTAKANFNASARCAALGANSPELSALFPER